jgi:hypothetical protein
MQEMQVQQDQQEHKVRLVVKVLLGIKYGQLMQVMGLLLNMRLFQLILQILISGLTLNIVIQLFLVAEVQLLVL